MEQLSKREAFELLYSQTYNQIFAYTISRIKNITDTDDVLQTVYISFYKRILSKGTVDEISAKKLLIKSIKHELFRYYGYRKKEVDFKSFDTDDIIEIEQEIQKNNNSNIEYENDILEEVWKMIEDKGDITKRIFILHYKVGFTLKECARSLKVSEPFVTNKIYRTINEIKLKYEKGVFDD